jgi:hypothetical protein
MWQLGHEREKSSVPGVFEKLGHTIFRKMHPSGGRLRYFSVHLGRDTFVRSSELVTWKMDDTIQTRPYNPDGHDRAK